MYINIVKLNNQRDCLIKSFYVNMIALYKAPAGRSLRAVASANYKMYKNYKL
jgi:hypothetical protein